MSHNASASARTLSIVALFLTSLTIPVAFPVAAMASVSFGSVLAHDTGAPCLNSIAVADVNADGKPDVLTVGGCANINGQGLPGSVSVLLGNGDGAFQPAAVYDSGGVDTRSLQVADVNGDGNPDVLTASLCSSSPCPIGVVAVLLGNGNGTFQPPVPSDSSVQPWSLAVADLNRDGKLDVVVAGLHYVGGPRVGGAVGVLLGNGDGTFQSVVTYDFVQTQSVALSDVNGDGELDALVTIMCSDDFCNNGFLAVLLGNGDGTFQPELIYDAGYQPESLAVADVNGDGEADVLLTKWLYQNSPHSAVGVLLGNGDGTFGPVMSYDSGAPAAVSIAVGDVNLDGQPDLAVAHCTQGTSTGYGCPRGRGIVSVLLGNTDGTFQAPLLYGSGGVWGRSVAVADMNEDGRPDLLAANRGLNGTGTVGVRLNNTRLCTAPPVVTLLATPTFLRPQNGKMVTVTVSGTISSTGTGCTTRTAAYAVKDEYGKVQPSGPVTLGAGGAYSFTVWLQASRLGADIDGRLYTVSVNATNNADKTRSQSRAVIVPHDQGH